jgi:hypothetical protein
MSSGLMGRDSGDLSVRPSAVEVDMGVVDVGFRRCDIHCEDERELPFVVRQQGSFHPASHQRRGGEGIWMWNSVDGGWMRGWGMDAWMG